jgi:hypothetical protein
MAQHKSRRARVFRRVLDYMNAGAWWEEKNGVLIVGEKKKVEFCISSGVPESGLSTDAIKEVQAIRTQIISNRGRRAAAKRVAVGKLPPEPTSVEIESWFLALSPEKREEVTNYINESLSVKPIDPDTKSVIGREEDSLDAALALEMVDMLDKSVSRVSTYKELEVKHASPWVQEYFAQAHRCYMFGLDVACAVLCRALLEAALVDLVDPTFSMRPGRNSRESHITNMIEATKGKTLNEARAKSAEKIRDAGNTAIHDLKTFREKYAPQLGRIVDDTRRLLVYLYR